jgi:predicted esterase
MGDLPRNPAITRIVTAAMPLSLLACGVSSTHASCAGTPPPVARAAPSRRLPLAEPPPPSPNLAPLPVVLAPRTSEETGPFEIPFLGKRTVYYFLPLDRSKPHPLVVNLHGMCNPPGYACWWWHDAASKHGTMVCPRGNTECAPGVSSWNESIAKMDEDLERAIAAVDAAHPGEISREGAFLTGFSLGGDVSPTIAQSHPGRWQYLILIEATVSLNADTLRKAGVRGVALVAGELGQNVYGQRKVAETLTAKKFPVKTWIMPKAGHWYSQNIDEIMNDAMEWLLSHGEP